MSNGSEEDLRWVVARLEAAMKARDEPRHVDEALQRLTALVLELTAEVRAMRAELEPPA
jgi:hypothetical protein